MASSSTFTAADGDGYEIQMGRFSRLLAPGFVKFTGITNAARVLDVGSGTGSLSFCLAQNPAIGAIVGIDYAPPYVAHARARNSDARVEFHEGDASALTFADASFDHALSMLVLQFVPQHDAAIEEMRRVTRPGGTLAAATWDTRGGLVNYRMFFDTAAVVDPNAMEHRKRAYTRPLTRPGELEAAFRRAGLADVVADTHTIRMNYTSFADFWAPVDGKDGPLAAYAMTLTPDMRIKVRDAVEKAYLDGEADGPRSYAAVARFVKGTVPA